MLHEIQGKALRFPATKGGRFVATLSPSRPLPPPPPPPANISPKCPPLLRAGA